MSAAALEAAGIALVALGAACAAGAAVAYRLLGIRDIRREIEAWGEDRPRPEKGATRGARLRARLRRAPARGELGRGSGKSAGAAASGGAAFLVMHREVVVGTEQGLEVGTDAQQD